MMQFGSASKPLLALMRFACLVCVAGCADKSVDVPVDRIAAPASDVAITAFCGSCHPMPNPANFPKHRWQHEVEQGLQIYRDSQRSDLIPTELDATVEWFKSFAPEAYDFGESNFHPQNSKSPRFRTVELPTSPGFRYCSVADVKAIPDGLLHCDVNSGVISIARRTPDSFLCEILARVADPVHIELSDLDADGVSDFVVADIGSFLPDDQRYGSLWWIHSIPSTDQVGGQEWKLDLIKTNYSRICDARPFDCDNDGDQDLVVAEFGFRFKGSIELLVNQGMVNGVPKFEARTIDKRNGAIHVPVVDLNNDGRLDIVTLVSQEHETIDVQLNVGNGQFKPQRIYTAPDPAYASSGIELVDLDGDQDLDVLYTNGDTFDDDTPKPFHSIQWLENEGTFPFKHHHLASLPGVYRAVAGDIDMDNDIDIAAVSLISKGGFSSQAVSPQYRDGPIDSVVWLEQKSKGEFVNHRIMADRSDWIDCELVDIDSDNDLDLLLGRYAQDWICPGTIVYLENQTISNP